MKKTKMTFILNKDDDGYPPDDYETVWVEKLENCKYRVDNIPFYITDISPDDIVEGENIAGVLFFKEIIERSSASVFRLVFFDLSKSIEFLSKLVEMGCRWEGSHLSSLYSIEVPASCDMRAIRMFLNFGSANGVLDYEEASIRS